MITTAIHIGAPIDRVFAIMTNFAHAPNVIQGITKVEVLSAGPVGVGTRFKETRVMFGRDATETMEVTAFDAPRSYTLTALSCGVEFKSAFLFEPDGAGTKVTLSLQGKPRTLLARILSPISRMLMGPMMKKCIVKDMEDVKRAAERPIGESAPLPVSS
jgi:hypothetical protein